MTTASAITFQFFRGDELLGTLVCSASALETAWQGGVFEPAPGYERVRPLFDNELHLLKSGRMTEWKEMWEEIQRPGLRLEPAGGGEPKTGFVIHIENDHAWWK